MADYKALDIGQWGTWAKTASDARTALWVEIGVDVQAHDTVLDATTASFLTADETKLDWIETGADVTDTTNVTAAWALMDSELTSIADVKALDQSVVSGAAPVLDATNFTNLPWGWDVSKVWTPVDNQLGVWTWDGTLEWDANLDWDWTILSIIWANAENRQNLSNSFGEYTMFGKTTNPPADTKVAQINFKWLSSLWTENP